MVPALSSKAPLTVKSTDGVCVKVERLNLSESMVVKPLGKPVMTPVPSTSKEVLEVIFQVPETVIFPLNLAVVLFILMVVPDDEEKPPEIIFSPVKEIVALGLINEKLKILLN